MQDIDKAGGVSAVMHEMDKRGDILLDNPTITGESIKERIANATIKDINIIHTLENPYSKEFKRRRAGRKGIGRFAVHRLGEKLTVITQTKGSEKALKLEKLPTVAILGTKVLLPL